MSIRHQLLSLLEELPLHGYGAQAALVERLGPEAAPHPARVYSLLRQLLDDGLVELVAPVEATSIGRRRAPKRYRITERGRERLDRWLDSPASCSGLLRDPTWCRIAVQMRVDPTRLPDLISAQVRCDRTWAHCLERDLRGSPTVEPWVVRLSQQRRQLHLAAEIESLEAIARLASLESDPRPGSAVKVPPARSARRPLPPRATRRTPAESGSR